MTVLLLPLQAVQGINRIRLEFKAIKTTTHASMATCINRIRLEFKGSSANLPRSSGVSINRIRLEFKVRIYHEVLS